ncbi:MAG: septum formation initiator family protein [Roseburia sp.]|nr:septum formation initiator family protein [Roseburia sp.]MEE0375923.1 septum formation initiator family protein [Lachnospiraceae bacterium]
MSMAFLAIIMIIAVVGINSISLRQKQAKYIAREQELQQQIDAENARTEELKELETYTKTKKYAEEVAKDKLGLVYDNEIIFKEED